MLYGSMSDDRNSWIGGPDRLRGHDDYRFVDKIIHISEAHAAVRPRAMVSSETPMRINTSSVYRVFE